MRGISAGGIRGAAGRFADPPNDLGSKPFGGLQLVLSGDFAQLPPVSKGGGGSRFLFQAATWATCKAVPLLHESNRTN